MTVAWKRIRRVWAVLGSSTLAVFVAWSLAAYRPSGDARSALDNGVAVAVETTGDGWHFVPTGTPRPTGLVFFPGGLVDPVAYAPLARAAAEAGHPAVLVSLPRRGAFGGADSPEAIDRALRLIAHHGAVERWVVAGHSLGGAVASRFVREQPGHAGGLLLIGTAHPRDFSLAHLEIPVTKLVGTRDGLATPARVAASRRNLPASARFVTIEGGNHSQFAWYGFQPGDRFARIERRAQQARTVAALLAALSMEPP